jgi:phytol kinase
MNDGSSSGDLIFAIAAVVGAYLALFASAELLHRRGGWSAQVTRKLVHVVGCLIALPLPLLFAHPWPVWILAVAFMGLMMVAGKLGLLPSVHGVERISVGAQVYPLGIALAFTVTEGAGYVVTLLALGISDTAAWAVGTRLGTYQFAIRGAVRTIEGSLAALVCTMGITGLTLSLAGTPVPLAALAGLGVGSTVALAEALTPYGIDNVTIPLAAAAALALMRVI